jgi:hypothetical protein
MRSNDELRIRRRCWREACKRWLALVVLLLPGIAWFPADAATTETRVLAATAHVISGAPAGGRAGHAAPRAIAAPVAAEQVIVCHAHHQARAVA